MDITMSQLLLFTVVVLAVSVAEAKHWPDFSCYPVNANTKQGNAFIHHSMGWNSCEDSFRRTKQECDKMCVLINRDIVLRTKKNDPFKFDIEAFITLMLNELGYEDEHRKDAPQDLVNKVSTELDTCRTKHREYETMKNFNNLPCEPYNDLFQCIDKAVAVGCPVEKSGNQ